MRLQFRLRTLLIALLLVGLMSYWFGPALMEILQPTPEQPIQPIRTHGGII